MLCDGSSVLPDLGRRLGVTPNAAEASWWLRGRFSAMSVRRCAGGGRDRQRHGSQLDRARQLVAVYREFTPLFEVAFIGTWVSA